MISGFLIFISTFINDKYQNTKARITTYDAENYQMTNKNNAIFLLENQHQTEDRVFSWANIELFHNTAASV